jgi:Flp pilus assembly CpaE family ATPase
VARPAVVCALPRDELRLVASGLREAGFEVLEAGPADAFDALLRQRRDIGLAIIDGETDFNASLELYSNLHGDGRDVPTLMVLSQRAFESLNASQQADDTTEYFTRPYSAESLRWRVEAMLIRAQTFDDGSGPILAAGELDANALARRAMIVAVFNPKGGVGKTTLATNLAATLQMKRQQRVLLVDADTVTGHIATSLGLEQVETVADAWEQDDTLAQGLAGVATSHANGLRVAVLAARPMQTDSIDPQRLADHLSGSKLGFDALIIDLHPDYGPLNRAIFERCDRILVPVTPDIPAIRAAVQFFEIAGDLGIRDRISMVVNRANSGVSVADMERTTGMPALGTIRSGGFLFVRAANEGTTVVEKFPREKVTEDFERLADRLLRREAPQASRSGERSLLGFLGRQREPVRA